MTQTSTIRYHYRTAPGLIMSPVGERETESMCSPHVLQQIDLVIAGADPFAAAATFTYAFPAQDGTGDTITVTTVIALGTTLADAADQIAAAFNATPRAGQLYVAASDGVDTITLVARSANISIAAASFVDAFTDAHTATTTQTVAAAAPSLGLGLFYVYDAIGTSTITGTPRGARPAALPTSATTVADLRGVIGRVVNQTTLPANFLDNGSTPDAYPAGQVWPGLLRGLVCARVDPASATITQGGALHVVIAAGAYSVIGSVAAVADGANTIQINTAPAGNIMARAEAVEENLRPFTQSSGRFVPLKINRTL